MHARPTLLCVFALLLAGCLPDLGRWQVGGTDGAVPPRDGAVEPTDSAVPSDGCAPPVTCSGGCPLPWVLGTVQDLDNDGERGCGGRVWRWSVTNQEEMCACEALDGNGELDALPFAVGFVPPATVVVGGQTQVQAIDANTDRVIWTGSIPGRALDLVPIDNPAGQPRLAVAVGTTTGERAVSLDIYEPTSGTREERWNTSELGIGSFASATVSPLNRQWLRVVKENGDAATDFNPWTRTVMNMPPHTPRQNGFFLHTIAASYSRGFHQTVWTGERTDLDGDPSRVQRVSLANDEGDNRIGPGDACTEFPGGLAYDVTCNYVHAVPDPTRENATIALCQYGSGQRRLVRLRTVGICITVVEQLRETADQRMWGLALAQANYWAP